MTLLGEDGWASVRNAAAQAEFLTGKIPVEDALKIRIHSDSGYAFYRTNISAAAGEYFFSVLVHGRSANGAIFEVYGFTADKQAKLLVMKKSAAGAVDSQLLQGKFTVPADYPVLRVGVGLSGNGEFLFGAPFLAAGAMPSASSDATMSSEHDKGWTASWIWLEKDSGQPRVLFRKRFAFPQRPDFAMVQLTADNGYTLLVNGRVVGSDVDWRSVEKYDLVPFLQAGDNEICLDVMNFDGSGGVILQGYALHGNQQRAEISTGADWSVSLPDGQAGAIQVIGPPPADPWRQLPWQTVHPPKLLKLEVLQQTRELQAGETFRLSFQTDHLFTPESLQELELCFFDQNGRESPLSAFPLIVRQELKVKTLLVELPISVYAAAGKYTWRLSGDTWDLNPLAGDTSLLLKAAAAVNAGSGSPFPKPDGNQMSAGKKPQSLFTYATSTPSLQSYLNWQITGGHMYEVTLSTGEWQSNGRFATTHTERKLLQILESDPFAGVYLKFRIDIPGWWASRYPDDLFYSNKGRSALQSFCSQNWREQALQAMKAGLDELLERPVGKAIQGVLIMGFRGGEFQLWGEDVGEYDCSPVAKQEFLRYQQDKQITLLISLPHPALEFPFEGDNEDLQRVREVYFRFVAERHADNLIHFAKEFKKGYGDRLAFGVYFGYGMEYGGSLKRMLFSGHLGIARILREAPLDLLSAPFSYGLRGWNRSHAFMNPVDSARLNQILPLGENDVRNYRTQYLGDSSGATILSFADSVLNNRRMRLLAAAHGAAVRYLALLDGTDFFSDPAMLKTIQVDNELVMRLRPEKLGAENQVALVTDQLSWCRGAGIPDSRLRVFLSGSRDLLQRTGRGVAFVTMEDYLDHAQLWQNLVIPLPGLLDKTVLAELEKRFASLPALEKSRGALVVCNGKLEICDEAEQLWDILALPEARQAGKETCWYIGENFRAAWDGKDLTLHIIE